MSRYPAPEIKDLPEDIRAKILEVQEKAGFVPQVFQTAEALERSLVCLSLGKAFLRKGTGDDLLRQ